ncbi:hypothetical protein H311_03629 [Anncaliia algerae PRA109]|nr:hypothetical protein H311_03629 [Anncaliia algerae PRA109]
MDKSFEEILSERLSLIFDKYNDVEDKKCKTIDLIDKPSKRKVKNKYKIKEHGFTEKNLNPFFFCQKTRVIDTTKEISFVNFKYEFDKLYTKAFMKTFDSILTYYENFDN